ncbi:MAG: S-methyl-5'-thioadenosine phosphorylase [Phototrophicaceae bacterium]
MAAQAASIAVIGGSGLYNMPGITDRETIKVTTPYGDPSSDIVLGTLAGKRIAFLARHGIGHVYTPTTVPYRANIYALKQLGVRFIIAVSACGSLREDYAPGHIVIPDQVFDNTKSERGGRTFFETGLVVHVSVAEPFSPELNGVLHKAVSDAGGTVHNGGTFITIEGPRFSTKGESEIFRSWGCSIIGMTTSPEAYLAREAEIAYGVIAHITDYDVWHDTEEPVTVDMVIRTLQKNVETVKKAVALAVERLDITAEYAAHNALKDALITDRAHVDTIQLDRLRAIIGRYFAP